MKTLLVIILALLFAGVGYYFGYDHGFEKAVEQDSRMAEENDLPVNDTEPLPGDSIVGVWQSVEDQKFTRTIYENGGYMDSYGDDEEATTNGSWVTFTSNNAPQDLPFTIEENTTYLQLLDAEEAYFFKIAELTEEKLVLIYLDRGGSLEFSRLP